MAFVIFYEKPGCATNARQRAEIGKAGHELVARNILTVEWSEEKLMRFFAGLPVPQWFNRAAPAVKSGLIDPDTINASTALAAMLTDPLLIRRPLMVIGEDTIVGFDLEQVTRLLGIRPPAPGARDMQSCSRPDDKADHVCKPPTLAEALA